jgi:molybdate transport system permease protein
MDLPHGLDRMDLTTWLGAAPLGIDAAAWVAILLSLKIAGVATVCALPPAIALAYLLARRDFPGKVLVDGIVHLPLVMPPVVTGYLLLLAFGRRGPVGMLLHDLFGITLAFRWTGAALAAAIMGFPLMVRAIRLSFEAIDPRLEAASGTLGAPPLATFFRVSLPLAVPGVLVGAVLAYAKALGEFGATITFVSNIPGETRTIAAAIYTLTQTPDGDSAALKLTMVSIALALAALAASEILQRRARLKLGLAG